MADDQKQILKFNIRDLLKPEVKQMAMARVKANYEHKKRIQRINDFQARISAQESEKH